MHKRTISGQAEAQTRNPWNEVRLQCDTLLIALMALTQVSMMAIFVKYLQHNLRIQILEIID